MYECPTHGKFEENYADCPTCAINCPPAAPEISEAMVRRAENETAQYIYGAEYAEQCLGWDDWWSRQSECRHNVARECARAALRAALADKGGPDDG